MKVLIADDARIERRVLQALLARWGYEVVLATSGSEAWDILKSCDAPQLVVLDWMMPDTDGLEICRRVRRREDAPYTYILLLTARNQKKDAVQALEAGADDFLNKPFDATELRARLNAGRRILDLQQQLIAAREGFRFQATHDALSGLWNHAAILDALSRELSRARRKKSDVAVVLADIDHFKRINDTYGHQAGDEVIRHVAAKLQTAVRSYDSVGRYGGEEFLLVLPEGGAGARARADSIRAEIAEGLELGGRHFELTISLGVASSVFADASDSLIRAADAALYRAKRSGRNRVECAGAADYLDEVPVVNQHNGG